MISKRITCNTTISSVLNCTFFQQSCAFIQVFPGLCNIFSQSISTHCFICVIQFNWFNLYHSFCFAGGVWRPIESLGEAKARTQTGDSLGCNFNFVYLMPVFQDDSWFVWNHVLRKYCQLRINAVRNILCEFVASTCLLQLICQFCNLSPWRRKVQTSLVSNISVQESRQFSYKVRPLK